MKPNLLDLERYNLIACEEVYIMARATAGAWPQDRKKLDEILSAGCSGIVSVPRDYFIAGVTKHPDEGAYVVLCPASAFVDGVRQRPVLRIEKYNILHDVFILSEAESHPDSGLVSHLYDLRNGFYKSVEAELLLCDGGKELITSLGGFCDAASDLLVQLMKKFKKATD